MNNNNNKLGFRRGAGVVLFALIIAELVSAFEATMVLGAMGGLLQVFGNPVTVGWLMTGFLLVAASSAAICGRLGDIYGRRRVLLIVLAIAGIGSLISAMSSSVQGVLIGRAIQGVSGAILPLCHGLVKENLPEHRVPFGIGILVACAIVVGGGGGGLLGGVIIDHLTWHWIFIAGAAMAGIALVVVWLLVPVSPQLKPKGRLDILGGILFAPAIAGVLLAVSRAPMWGWGDWRTLSLLCGSLVLLVSWACYELRLKEPLIDVRLMANRQIGLANVAMIFLALGALQSHQAIVLLLTQPTWTGVGLGITSTSAGLVFLPAMALSFFAGPVAGLLAAKYGGRMPMIIGGTLITCAWVAIAFSHDSIWFIFIMLAVQHIGNTFCYSTIPMLIVEAAPASRISEANGLTTVFRATFQGIGAQVVAFVLAFSIISDPARDAVSYPTNMAYTTAFGLMALFSFLCLCCAFALPRRSSSSAVSPSTQLLNTEAAG